MVTLLIVGPFLAMVVCFVLGLVALIRAIKRRGQPRAQALGKGEFSPGMLVGIYWFIAFCCAAWLSMLGDGLAIR